MKYRNDDLCICGHQFEAHCLLPSPNKKVCLGYYRNRVQCIGQHAVHAFKLDNLAYIEKRYSERFK